MDRIAERKREIDTAVAEVRAIEGKDGVNRESLDRIKARLLRLAARKDLFSAEDFPPPAPGSKRNSCLYRISEDADHRFALYANASASNYGTPAHNHTTWAVIVGVSGEELNRFYERTDGHADAATEKGSAVVRQGTGVAFIP